MTRVLITGADGLLGYDLIETLSQSEQNQIIAANRAHFDITNLKAAQKFIEQARPNLIIHAAAFTNVDACETQQELAFRVNAYGARHVARAAQSIGAKLVHISTDYVFDGTKEGPYGEEDRPNPINVYGASKLQGERFVQDECPKCVIVRTAWLYGLKGRSFVKTMLQLASTKKEITVVDDQRGAPTWAHDLARQIQLLIPMERDGIYHATSQGSCSWYEFAVAIFRERGLSVRVKPVASESFPRPAPRPKNSVLENRRLKEQGLACMPHWKEALTQFMKVLSKETVPS